MTTIDLAPAPALAAVPSLATERRPVARPSRRVPRRILMTTDTIGGAWTYSIDLCRELNRHGVEVILATMGPVADADQREQVAGLRAVHLVESSFRLEWMDDPWEDIESASRWLMQLEQAFSPDLIHLNGYAHAALPWSAPVVVAAHSCINSWWQAVHGCPPPERYDLYAATVRRAVEAADLVIAPTQAMLDAFSQAHGRPARSRVIPNGTRAERFHRGVKRHHVLAAGRLWDPAKNTEALCRIAGTLPWPIHLAGRSTGPDGRPAELPGIVRLGHCGTRQMAEVLSEAAIFALPARYEPFGLSVLEAACSGCALVLGDIPSLREVWGDAALFVPPDDALALRTALLQLIDDEDLRYRQGTKALERARRFTAAAMADAYLEACADLLRPRAVRGKLGYAR